MQNLNILNSRETKHILEKLHEQYGFDIAKNDLDFIFLMNKENRLYVVTKDMAMINTDLLKIDALGNYFGEVYKESIRLSIEGAQLIGPHATKNKILIDEKQMLVWVKGDDIDFENTGKDFVIVAYKNPITSNEDILGCGKYKDGKLMNYISKSRKLVVVNYE
jgi:NOL1/NOP2/fmu family ribosome biogenesis protein